MKEDFWSNFTTSGKVEDYLKYKSSEQEAKVKNENYYQGLDYKGTNNRGE